MRLASIAIGLSLTLGACGGGGGSDGDGDGDDTADGSDAPDAAAPSVDSSIDPPARGFQVKSVPTPPIMPGQEITYCYYFRTPNTETMAVNHFVSSMDPGSHHMIMFRTTTDMQPPGTVSASGCGIGAGTNVPQWIYAAQTPEADMPLPTDDGTGKPLAIEIPPNTPAYFQMHYLNATDVPITPQVTLNFEALPAATPFTKTAAFVTYNGDIAIPAGAVGHVESKSCSVPVGAKFWLMSTHAHKQATSTAVKNGTQVAFSSTDWEHPGVKAWMTPAAFYSFTDKITYECTYTNESNRIIDDGDSAQTDEMCMATGFYFVPGGNATPRFCYNESSF